MIYFIRRSSKGPSVDTGSFVCDCGRQYHSSIPPMVKLTEFHCEYWLSSLGTCTTAQVIESLVHLFGSKTLQLSWPYSKRVVHFCVNSVHVYSELAKLNRILAF